MHIETSSTEGQNCVEHVTMQGQIMHLPMPTSPECGYFPNNYEVEKIQREKRRKTICISMSILVLSTLLFVFVLFEVFNIIDTDSRPRD
ncbi:hypothetical protein WR25_24049 [Diploscapter pachys]|uniref:Uncharacterized protein n=1 Tax=Diploscapter pachys TaxID=2018661 RepID=A0A2A2JUZ9_9BILA|nr:hypothetical protein WR25_24049 [Diploscapter pachys]